MEKEETSNKISPFVERLKKLLPAMEREEIGKNQKKISPEENGYQKEAVFTQSDQRKMVSNSAVHPYNGLGKLISIFKDPYEFYTTGTAFLITTKHIMTAAHNLYSLHEITK
jgi:V8-like Glu-specific endopeptidase